MVVYRNFFTTSHAMGMTLLIKLIVALIPFLLFYLPNCYVTNELHAEEKEPSLFRLKWRTLNEDLEIATLKPLENQPLASELNIIRTRLKSYKIDILSASDYGLKGSDAKTFCELGNAHVCINANFFDEYGEPLGLVVRDGLKKKKVHKGGSLLDGIFQIIKGTPYIIEREKYKDNLASYAVQAGPILIRSGRSLTTIRDKTTESKRAGICIDNKKRLLLFSSTPGLGGISIEFLQKILLEPSIGCLDALNFDGGGSAQMEISLPSKLERENSSNRINKEEPKLLNFNGRDNVPVVLALVHNHIKTK